ncbi:unnamed protein product [Ectocarpus sp. 12 AP-2014]
MADVSGTSAWLENESLMDLCLLAFRTNVSTVGCETKSDVIQALAAGSVLGHSATEDVGKAVPPSGMAIAPNTTPPAQEVNTAMKRKRETEESAAPTHGAGCFPDPSSAMTNRNILVGLAQLVPDNQFLFFAPVATGWRAAWHRPAITAHVTPDTTMSQLQHSFECGLPRNHTGLCAALARLGKLNLLACAVGVGCPMNAKVCASAALGGHLKVLQWARRVGCSWDASTTAAAARGGHLKTLQWCVRQGCPSDATLCEAAAAGGHLNILRGKSWKRNFPWSCSKTCAGAARGGHLDVLKWALRNGCVGDKQICKEASRHGHLHVLQWARKNGCCWYKTKCLTLAEQAGHQDVVAWIREEQEP